MIVYFLRHADAVPEASSDFERELSDKGQKQAKTVGAFCRRRDIIPEVIYTSPAARAVQTAKLVAKKLRLGGVKEAPFLNVGMAPERGIAGLIEHADHHAIMVVGHEPDFSELIGALIGMKTGEQLRLRKASLTSVDLQKIEPGRGVLQFSIPVRLMK